MKFQYKTIVDSGYILKEAEAYCRKNTRVVVKRLERHIATAYSDNVKQAARDTIFAATR